MGEIVPRVWGVLSERLLACRREVSAEGGLAPLAEVRSTSLEGNDENLYQREILREGKCEDLGV